MKYYTFKIDKFYVSYINKESKIDFGMRIN